MKGFTRDKKFIPISTRKKHAVTRKGRFDEQRLGEPKYVVVKRTLPSKLKLKKELVQVAETDNLSEAFRFLRQQEGDYIVDRETGNTINRTLQKREPFPVGERRPENFGDQDVIDAVSGKKLTQEDLIAMQRQPRKALSIHEDFIKNKQGRLVCKHCGHPTSELWSDLGCDCQLPNEDDDN